MPIVPPALDDRGFDDLVEELISRIPAHTPEWTNPRLGDPGRTMIELFAWLADTLLYRANLIPERQRLAFLRLLGAPMRPAVPAHGLVSVSFEDQAITQAITLRPRAALDGPARFETLSELTVLPVTGEAYCKRALPPEEAAQFAAILPGLRELYGLGGNATPYITTAVFPDGAAEPAGFDLITRTVDDCLWLALLAPTREAREAVRAVLGSNAQGGQQVLSIGVAPTVEIPTLFEEVSKSPPVPHVWEITGLDAHGLAEYHPLTPLPGSDTTDGLTRRGVQRLLLPAAQFIGAPSNDVRQLLRAGVGDQPPRLDDRGRAERLVAWLRLRPTERLHALSLSWVGINAVEIDQRETIEGRIVGQGDGSIEQEFQLPGRSVERETLRIEVEEPDRGFQPWRLTDDVALEGRDEAAYTLDSEAGTIRCGDGVRGRLWGAGQRVRVATMRDGGGSLGNLPAGSLKQLTARDIVGNPTPALKALQALPTLGGEETESLAEAERRVPALFRHRDRAVTAEDYRRLAAEAPGVRLGRVEILPGFKPHQRRSGVPGIVSVMVLPFKDTPTPPNPRPDRPIIEAVHTHLGVRRPLTTELYVIGCEYVPLGLSVAIRLLDGFAADGLAVDGRERRPVERESVLHAVREALRRFVWPLPPGGIDGGGWPLGRAVRDRELEVVVSRVPGVDSVEGLNLFTRDGDQWRRLRPSDRCAPVALELRPWQLPELLTVVAVVGDAAPTDLRAGGRGGAGGADGVGGDGTGGATAADRIFNVPVVPEIC